MAHLPPHLLNSGEITGCGREGGAGPCTPRIVQNDNGWLHAGAGTTKAPSAKTTCRPNHANGNSESRMNVVGCCGEDCPGAAKSLICWRPRRYNFKPLECDEETFELRVGHDQRGLREVMLPAFSEEWSFSTLTSVYTPPFGQETRRHTHTWIHQEDESRPQCSESPMPRLPFLPRSLPCKRQPPFSRVSRP